VRVPNGFALTGGAFRLHLREAGVEEEIYAALDDLDVRDLAALERVGRFARERVRSARLPAALVAEVESAYRKLSGESESGSSESGSIRTM
jgi:pyruvate,water dikinase